MKANRSLWVGMIASLGLIILILDARTAIKGAQEGIALCIGTILPSLFPFCVLTKLINASLAGRSFRYLRPIGKLCKIPEGAESIFLLGFLGGYPMGAQSINDACKNGAISSSEASRMLAFCNNAGPAFLFGVLGCLFETTAPLWWLLIIHVLSAIAVGAILQNPEKGRCSLTPSKPLSLPKAIEESVRSMALICGWVILFRIVLHFGKCWFLWMVDDRVQAIIAGLMELSNGCISLSVLPSYSLRYILSACFLSFGGLCVAMQTMSVAKNVKQNLYFPGKVLQTLISLVLACLSQYIIFPAEHQLAVPIWLPTCCIVLIGTISAFLRANKKVVAFAQ